jgi:hypothetical protein
VSPSVVHATPFISLLAGFLILVAPALLNYIVAIYLIAAGVGRPQRDSSFCELISPKVANAVEPIVTANSAVQCCYFAVSDDANGWGGVVTAFHRCCV